jgi:teichuronic acid biosynthesis glycosyltransferase TuaC
MRTERAGVSIGKIISTGAGRANHTTRRRNEQMAPALRFGVNARPVSNPGPICLVTTSYPADDGDPSGHFVKAEVAELELAGHEVTVVTPRTGGAFGWPGVASRLRQRPWRAMEAAAWMVRAAAQLRAARPARIIAHWSVPSAWPIVSSAGLATIPLEIVSHGGDVRLIAGMPERARKIIVSRLLARASSWRFVSHSLLEQLAAALDHGDEAALRAIATVASSPLSMLDVEEDVRLRRSTLGDRPLYVCAGRLVPSKRVDRVIDYVAGHRAGQPILVVIGDGPERARLEKLAQRWRLDVRFLGNTPRRETLTWIGAADELVHASVAEGISTVVREAEHLGVEITRL